MPALQGVGVLVTRPEQQALPLCRLLQAEGASALRLPALDIKAAGDQRDMSASLGDLRRFDAIIFTSANAVRFGTALLDQRRDLTLIAIGPATARALNEAGYRVAGERPPREPGQGPGPGVFSRGGFDSEALLLHPTLERPAGRRMLIVTGCNGRPFLQQELTRRGAQVRIAEVYRRLPVTPGDAELASLLQKFSDGAVQVITATSLEIAASLLRLATPELRAEFERVHWLVPGERVARGVRELGLAAPLLSAMSADDQDLVAALVRWRSGA
jgi:uroporphyrinogen-III synthase